MRPRLLVLSGPLKDSTIPLSEGEITIGREASNGIAIADPSVSRKHCLLTGRDGRFRVRDLDSRNGTLVNRAAVDEQWLQHGDEIAAGDSSFLFLLEEEELSPAEGRVEFEDALCTAETTILHPRDVVYLQPDRLLRELPATSRVARNLNALLKISRIVHAILDLNQLQEQLLDLIFEVAPAGRGAILLADREGHQFNSMFARMRQAGEGQLVKVSRTVARQVLEQGVAILGSDVPSHDELREVESLAASQVRSLLCVPLTVFQRVIGCIYLDSESLSSRLNEEHLQLVTAIAGISAVALENARRLQWLEEENERLTVEISQDRSLVGEGARMKEVYQFLKRVAPAESTVLIEGESGTGKELAARAIHRNSPRASKPFIAINCAAIPETLLESDLFGHERGAFTGAASQKKGRFEVADGGVVFLDEIGELATALQVKLLRVLQEREFERVGGTHPIKVDIRLIAATNCNLEQAVRSGKFRQDLYYRLAVLKITMPTLRDRREDIPMLVRHFVQKHAKRCKVKPRPVSREALACLVNYDWPGNVRELENAIEHALVLGASDMILPEDLPESLLERTPLPEMTEAKYHQAVKELKKQLILDAVEQTQGSYADAARILGVHPNYLHRLIRNLELKESLKDALRDIPARGLSGISGGNA
ncbi:MAG TPA: sigma 54-interacting transcriptional regulator [Candidatus Eremiobacteraceae bacterium]|nr:sigma 54-interacting transcriptional regulator [Candidatus Eremiobacteraceae bacterium]